MKAHRQECARHTISAKPQVVFEAWTKPELVAEWWGPEGFTTRILELDLYAGGRFVFEMTAPSGKQCLMKGIYRRIKAPDLLEFEIHDHCNLDLPAGISPQETPSLVSVEFSSFGDSTTVIVYHTELETSYERLAIASWSGSLMRLAILI